MLPTDLDEYKYQQLTNINLLLVGTVAVGCGDFVVWTLTKMEIESKAFGECLINIRIRVKLLSVFNASKIEQEYIVLLP